MAELVKVNQPEDYQRIYTTLLLSKSVSLKFVQEQLGHSTAQTTLNVYSHVLPSVNKKAMNILNNLKFEHDLSMGAQITPKSLMVGD